MARYVIDKETGEKKLVEIKRRKAKPVEKAKTQAPSKAKTKSGGK